MEGSFTIRLLDMNQKVILSTKTDKRFKSIDISGLASGSYILEYTVDGETSAEKIIKL